MGQIFWHRMQEKLGLSEAQVKAIRDLLDAQRTTMRAEAQQLMAARKELRGLMQQASVDQGAVKQKAAQIADLQAKLFNARLQTQLDLRAQLTPEQWQQWQALRKGMGPRWGQRAPGFGPGL
jgi:Spy/CpxP family protein refolding chaperone